MTKRVCNKIKIKFNHWLPQILLKILFKSSTYCAVTLGCGIYFSGTAMYQSLLTHELVHVAQIEQHGIFKFYLLYICQFLVNLYKFKNWEKAYYFITFEQEAYKTQAFIFSDYLLDEKSANQLANTEVI